MQIKVMSNIKDIKRKMTKAQRAVIPKATSKSLNKTMARTYTFVVSLKSPVQSFYVLYK